MKIKMRSLRRLIREETIPPGSTNLGKLLDDVIAQFTSKMQAQYSAAGPVIEQEAGALKVQLTAQIKAAAAKVKMASSQPS